MNIQGVLRIGGWKKTS